MLYVIKCFFSYYNIYENEFSFKPNCNLTKYSMATGFQIVNILFIFRGRACMDKVDRRLELLKLEGLGFSQVEVVNELIRNWL